MAGAFQALAVVFVVIAVGCVYGLGSIWIEVDGVRGELEVQLLNVTIGSVCAAVLCARGAIIMENSER